MARHAPIKRENTGLMGRRESFSTVLYPLSLVTYGLVMELAYVSDSKSEFCGFESHPGHQ